KVVENQTDPQYLFLSERLDGIEDNWVALHKMYEDRDKVLKRDVEAQSFFRDATLMDKLINKQEALITKEVAPTPESVEEARRNLSTFQAAMPANDEKISQVIAVGRDLANRGVFPVEKLVAKCDQLEQKR
ncbi:hypothetical protein FTX61_27655, partial [Nitriliruptoraceae bacterium ZYF776]|nr:hypothetical protein [Profundirhabdus halotolerans]